MIIIGMDPGLAISGYGIIEYVGNKFNLIEYGAVITDAKMPFPKRLEKIYLSYLDMIDKFKPDAIAVEELFYNKNVKTAIAIGEARGVHLLAGQIKNIPLYEYTPLQIKQGICGYGRADKKQVQEMVKLFLNLKEVPKPDDAADGVAVAICHAHSLKFAEDFRITGY